MVDYEKRREWAREESMLRQKLRPLRNKVNRILKATGIPHSHHYMSGRISGLSHCTAGWETESEFFSEPQYVSVRIVLLRSTYLPGEQVPAERLAWRDIIAKALRVEGLVVATDGQDLQCRLKVYPAGTVF